MSLAEKLFGSFSDRELKKINPLTKQVLALEGKYQAMSDAELQAQTPALKQKLADGKTLDDILPDAFAVCREAAWRVLGMKHFPVQVTGGIALHRGDIAEMQTGEGKTLVATLPAYLNALTGEGVHIVTVNDYLAKRDSEWMGKLYRWLGLSVGLIVQGMDGDARREAYNADITYGTNNEFGFDYLRDNMVTYKDNMVQRGHAYAVVDELLPRDVVTQAIEKEMEKEGSDHVWLSFKAVPEETIRNHFPHIYEECLKEGYDITKEPAPVVPAQHYFMGGIYVDHFSETTMDHLYAVGETSCNGVHGKNRLASNSLLESLVFAERAAGKIAGREDEEYESNYDAACCG